MMGNESAWMIRYITFNTNEAVDGKMHMNAEYWRELALKDLIPYWYRYVRDKEYGGFYPNLSRDWRPFPPWDKYPAMISRQVFGFSTAYLLSGEDSYLDAARDGVDYLLEHAWDKEYGGWYDMLSRTGEPKETTKSIPLQLYTNVGLTMYFFTTGDIRIMPYIDESIRIQQTCGHDKEYGGYYQSLNRDLSVLDDGKNKHAHYGYVGSLLLNLWLATRDPEILKWECHLTDLTLERMMDQEYGWINGYCNRYDRQWKLTPFTVNGAEIIPIGAQLTAALSFLRLYHQSGNTAYLEQGKALSDRINRYGWDSGRGVWIDLVEKAYPHRPAASCMVSNWIQIYGCFLQLQLYHLTKDRQYLERFIKSEAFWDKYLRDKEYGSVFSNVSPDGILDGDGRKAEPWRTSYHEMEHTLLNYLYLNVYINRQPASLHFRMDCSDTSKKRFVSLADDPSVQITGVKVNGQSWTGFDARERSIILPAGKDIKVKVIFGMDGA
ncbi:MAG: hypothetical protein FIA99_12770 [Ruminiclostridium sp.]|nr:hypothetical protein [Ruminiclostridium sp.]